MMCLYTFRPCLLLAVAWWRGQEGMDVRWLTSGTGRLHLRHHLRNLQDLAELFKIHHLVETMKGRKKIHSEKPRQDMPKPCLTLFYKIKTINNNNTSTVPYLYWCGGRPRLQTVAWHQWERRACNLWEHLDWNWRQTGRGKQRGKKQDLSMIQFTCSNTSIISWGQILLLVHLRITVCWYDAHLSKRLTPRHVSVTQLLIHWSPTHTHPPTSNHLHTNSPNASLCL